MHRVYEGYERRKRAMSRLDFEDMLGLALRLFDEHPDAAREVRSRFAAFTVDEFQDVNPLQAGLLDRWLGDRDELCLVGDDYQTIYAFTGASPEHLLGFTRRFPQSWSDIGFRSTTSFWLTIHILSSAVEKRV